MDVNINDHLIQPVNGARRGTPNQHMKAEFLSVNLTFIELVHTLNSNPYLSILRSQLLHYSLHTQNQT